MIKLILPYAPSVNRYWRACVKHGTKIHYISKEGVEYCEQVEKIINSWRKSNFCNEYIFGNDNVIVDYWMCVPDRRSRDIDNIQKALFDSLTKAKVWEDDVQVVSGCISKVDRDSHNFKAGAVVVHIYTVEEYYNAHPEMIDKFSLPSDVYV